ncbi:MAG: hypothetical protein LBL90_00325 [Prevotellaceae bacterium]|nr:hypothetical protein [Prevotellaceae bacterium]
MLSQIDEFVSIKRFSSLNEEGKQLSLSVWESKEAAAQWRNQIGHRESQKSRPRFLI